MAIDLKEALSIIKSGEQCSVRCLTADVAKCTGGKILDLPECRIPRKQLMEKSGAATSGASDILRPANHYENFTLNLELKNGEIRKVHPILITEVNNMKVL